MSNIPGTPVDGNIKTAAVVTIADIATPKLTELSAVTTKEISCYLPRDGWGIAPTQGAITDERECDKFVAELPGTISFSGATIRVIDNTGTTFDATFNDAVLVLVSGNIVYLVRRRGKAWDGAWSIGDKVDVFKVRVGVKRAVAGEANSSFKSEYSLFVEDYRLDVALVA